MAKIRLNFGKFNYKKMFDILKKMWYNIFIKTVTKTVR